MMTEIYNELTREFDNHLKPDWKSTKDEGYCEGTYLYYDESDYKSGYLCIRFPGATRGCVYFDPDGTISQIRIYEDTCFYPGIGCYKRSLLGITSKWIGKKLDLTGGKS